MKTQTHTGSKTLEKNLTQFLTTYLIKNETTTLFIKTTICLLLLLASFTLILCTKGIDFRINLEKGHVSSKKSASLIRGSASTGKEVQRK